jgi:hypothetical protein
VTDLGAVAAFVAAGLSLVNVGFSARLAGRGQREHWRRSEERPIVARCLTLSQDARREWWHVSGAKEEEIEEHWQKGLQLARDLRFEVAQLDLCASVAVRHAAQDLVLAHEDEVGRLAGVINSGRDDDREGRQAAHVTIQEAQSALVERTRRDFGLDLSLAVPPNSILGRILAKRNGPLRRDRA